MADGRLEVTDALGRRVIHIDKPVFSVGRRSGNDLQLVGSDVSRDHAEIATENGAFVLRDRGSRYGTYVNGEGITEHTLQHADLIRLGRSGGAEMVFLLEDATQMASGASSDRHTTSAVGDLRQVAALLEGLRALGSGRVLDEVLALVMDSALEVTGAERGFIMLANAGSELEFKIARGRGRLTLSGKQFETSRKIPEEVFSTGQEKIVADLLDGDLANVHMGTVALGIRHVLCTPLRLVRYLDRADQQTEEKRIGVLYLDSREKGALLSRAARTALETLATEAAVAIENARLYRETLEKGKMEQEMRIAAEIQQALLPEPSRKGPFFDAFGQSVACRSIGGDFFDYVDLPSGAFGFAVGDVAGKGAPAALADGGDPGRVLVAGADRRAALRDALAREPGAHPPRDRVAVLHGVLRVRLAGRLADLLQCGPQSADGVHRQRRHAARKRRPDPRALRARDVRGRHDHARRRATCWWPSATA